MLIQIAFAVNEHSSLKIMIGFYCKKLGLLGFTSIVTSLLVDEKTLTPWQPCTLGVDRYVFFPG